MLYACDMANRRNSVKLQGPRLPAKCCSPSSPCCLSDVLLVSPSAKMLATGATLECTAVAMDSSTGDS